MMLVVLSFNIAKAQDVPTKESGKKSMLVIDSTNKEIKTTESKSANKSILNSASKNTSNSNLLVFVQCSGFVNKRERCKVKVSSKNGKCFQHQ